jgi:hypothetical protein
MIMHVLLILLFLIIVKILFWKSEFNLTYNEDFNIIHKIRITAYIIDIVFDLIIGRPTIKQLLFVDKVPSHCFSQLGL